MIPNADDFAEAIGASEPTPVEIAMLQCHFRCPNKVTTAANLSQLMGWEGQAASAHYGKLAGRVAQFLSWEPNDRDSYWPNMKVSSLVLGSKTAEYEWKLRPQVAAAMEQLGLTPYGVDVTEARLETVSSDGSDLFRVEGRRVWIKSFWGFDTTNESYLGFTRLGDRERFIRLHKPGDLVLIYGAVAEETAKADRRQALGFLEIDAVPVTDQERSSETALQEKIKRGWQDKWVHAVPVRRAWEVKRRIEVRHIAPTTYRYERARAIATQGELLRPEEAAAALRLPVSPVNVYLELPVTSPQSVESLREFLKPSKGIKPSFGRRKVSTEDGAHYLYLMKMSGDIAHLLRRDTFSLVNKVLMKVGYTNNPARRLTELNCGLPAGTVFRWEPALESKEFEDAQSAFDAENIAKVQLAKAGESLGNEFFLGSERKLLEAFGRGAGRASFNISTPAKSSR